MRRRPVHWLPRLRGLWPRAGALALVVWVLTATAPFQGVERRGLDLLFELRGPRGGDSPVVLVTIDEDSFDELDLPWPWPRALHARLLDALRPTSPAVIGLDVLFVEPSARGPDDDAALAGALGRGGRVVLAAARTIVQETAGGAAYTKVDLNPPIPLFRVPAPVFGVVNLERDPDAAVRTAVLSQPHQGESVPSFALAVYRAAVAAGLPAGPSPAADPILINYRGGPGSFPRIPYHRLVTDGLGPETLAGKVVLVGATSPVLHDLYPTPFAPRGEMPGVEIQASVLETLLLGNALRQPPRVLVGGLVLAASLLVAWAARQLHPLHALAAVVGAAALHLGAAVGLFVRWDVWLDLGPVPLALGLGYVAGVVEHFVRERRERRRLSRFFSPAVVREIVRLRDDERLGTTRRPVTVLFSDIRGFTALSERMPPEEVAAFLREYMTLVTEAVFAHGGTVDKYMGDGLMALFNVPFDQPDHPLRAVRTALDLQARLAPLAGRFQARYGADLRCGVGIHTGEAIVGILGAAQRLEYTAIGDTINLGSRLEGLTKDLKASILISDATRRELRAGVLTRRLGAIPVRGRTQPVEVHAVVAEEARRAARIPLPVTVTISVGSRDLVAPLRDLSRTGLAVRDADPALAAGQVVQLVVEAPGGERALRVEALVVWARDGGAGFLFGEMGPEDQAGLERLVAGQPVGADLAPTAAPAAP